MEESKEPWRLLVFGASGAIGRAVCEVALGRGWQTTAVSREFQAPEEGLNWVCWDPLREPCEEVGMDRAQPFDGVCWAQGSNLSDSVLTLDIEAHLDLYRANCLFVLKTLSALTGARLLRPGGARLCLVSSIWEQRARPEKLSYTMSKAAIGGLVRSACLDLAPDGHLINAVLPGVLYTPMSVANLTPGELDGVAAATPFNRLPDVGTVAELICFLASAANSSISGQSIAVDLGMSNGRLV